MSSTKTSAARGAAADEKGSIVAAHSFTPEQRAKISETMKKVWANKVLTPEEHARRSQAQKDSWARRRGNRATGKLLPMVEAYLAKKAAEEAKATKAQARRVTREPELHRAVRSKRK